MRKLLLILVNLVVIGCHTAYADIISVPDFSADSGVPHLNNFKNTVVNVIDGNVSGSAGTGATINILADSISEPEMANDVNPRVRDNELLQSAAGYDTFSSGTLTQNSFVSSGGTPATSVTLTSDISAVVAYVNGYRISKGATSETYAASMDTYVDLSQAGIYTLSPVAVGATQPTVASNSARLAKVTTSGTAITTVVDLANRRLPGLVTPANYRTGLYVSRDSTSTFTVFPGTCEINNVMINKTSTTTLNLGTAGDWAGGSSLRATSTYAYVGMDFSGNIKMHTTAPTHQNYAVSLTTGKKRYATWSGTVYRVLGWGYMNASGSGELNTYEVGNIKEGDVWNYIYTASNAQFTTTSTTYVDDTSAVMHFYSSGNPVEVKYGVGGDGNGDFPQFTVSFDSTGILGTNRDIFPNTSTIKKFSGEVINSGFYGQGTHTISGRLKSLAGGAVYINERTLTAEEK